MVAFLNFAFLTNLPKECRTKILKKYETFLLHKIRSADARDSLNIKALLLQQERLQLLWYVLKKNTEKTAAFNTRWSRA